MEIEIIQEAGYGPALEGIALSRLQPLERMPEVALRLARRGEPHCKFMRQMAVWLRITAPWYWWKHFDTYRIGVEQQSTSTMYRLLSRELAQEDFAQPLAPAVLATLNRYIAEKRFREAVAHLPGGYLYTRVVCTNYSTLVRIIEQRRNHRLEEWAEFIAQVMAQLAHVELIDAALGVEEAP